MANHQSNVGKCLLAVSVGSLWRAGDVVLSVIKTLAKSKPWHNKDQGWLTSLLAPSLATGTYLG